MRLGNYEAIIKKNSLAQKIYGGGNFRHNNDESKSALKTVDRHRHRYEFNNNYREIFEKNFSYEYEASGGGTHQALQVCCSILSEKLSSKDFSKLEMKLRMLHQLRVKADYKLDAPFSKGDLLTMKLEQDKAEKLLIELIKNVS